MLLPLIVASSTIAANTIDPLPRLGVDRGPAVTVIVLAVIACAVLPFVSYAASGALLLSLNSAEDNKGRRFSAIVGVSVLVLAVVVGWLLRTDDSGGRATAIGSMTVILGFAFVVGGLAVFCRLLSDLLSTQRWAAPAALRAIRVERPPLLAGLLVWLLAAPILGQAHAHDVRRIAGRDPATGVPLEQQVSAWRDPRAG